jgi:hypothetical protein
VQSLPLGEYTLDIIVFKFVLLPEESYHKALDYLHNYNYMTCVWDGHMIFAVKLEILGHEIEKNPSMFLSRDQIGRFKAGPLSSFAIAK